MHGYYCAGLGRHNSTILEANSHLFLTVLISSSLFNSLESIVLINKLKINCLFCTETHCIISRLILFGEMKAVYFSNH